MKAKNVKQAMDNDQYVVNSIRYKWDSKILVIFHPRFSNSRYKICDFWINRDYFKREYPRVYENS
jgi:hypothetical protein